VAVLFEGHTINKFVEFNYIYILPFLKLLLLLLLLLLLFDYTNIFYQIMYHFVEEIPKTNIFTSILYQLRGVQLRIRLFDSVEFLFSDDVMIHNTF